MPAHLFYTRLEGCGNNFIVINDIDRSFSNSHPSSSPSLAAAAKALQDAHFGLGSDGLMVVLPSTLGDFEVAMFNPDGSLMGMCGNGIRCVTRFLFLQGLVAIDRREIAFIVEGRTIICSTADQGKLVRVAMGPFAIEPSRIPVVLPKECSSSLSIPFETVQFKGIGSCVSMGNPHCVFFVPNLDELPLREIGPLFENHPIFPKRANIEFVEIISKHHVRVRVWERGVGITLACGTGACAVAVAGILSERLDSNVPITVSLPGGDLSIEVDRASQQVSLTGPAREISSGEVCADFFSRVFPEYSL